MMPMVAILTVFSGTLNLDTPAFLDKVRSEMSEEDKAMLMDVENNMTAIALGLKAMGMPEKVKEAQVMYVLALAEETADAGFVDRLLACYRKEQSDQELVDTVNSTFGSNVKAEDYTVMVDNVRSQYVNTEQYVDYTTKNNLDLVQWAIAAEQAGWGYVWGTFGQVLSRDSLAAKVKQYPDGVGNYADFIKKNYLGRRTADCVGFIKGYSWYDPETDTVNYKTNGMPDTSADGMFNNATSKGTIDTIPEIPGLAVRVKGHIGAYIGNGYVIEAFSTQRGVIRTKLADRSFTHWLKIPYINYIEDPATEES